MPDPVADLLRQTPVPPSVREDAWDAFQQAQTADDLAPLLKDMKLPESAKAALWDLKHGSTKAVTPETPALTPPAAATSSSMLETVKDVATGVGHGVVNSMIGLGQLAHKVPGVGALSDLAQKMQYGDVQPTGPMFDVARQAVAPTNTAQQVGFTGEQIGEFLLPTGATGKLGTAAAAGGLALAQSGSPAEAGVVAGLTAVLPGGGAIPKISTTLKESAYKSMAQALGATKEWAKSESAKLVPQMLERGIGGSRSEMLSLAKGAANKVGKNLADAYKDAAAAGATVPSDIISGNLLLASDAMKTPNAAGTLVTIPGTETIVKKLDELAEFVQTLGPDIPVDKAAHIKRTWDQIVSKAGLFGPKATSSSTDSGTAWAIREASNSFRDLINTNPAIADLNAEVSFWTGLKKVLKETEKRTLPQSTGLIRAGMSGTGAIVGAMSGDSMTDKAWKSAMGGLLGNQLVAVVRSPAFKSRISAPLKNYLADALASGSVPRVTGAVGKIVAALPAQLRPALAEP